MDFLWSTSNSQKHSCIPCPHKFWALPPLMLHKCHVFLRCESHIGLHLSEHRTSVFSHGSLLPALEVKETQYPLSLSLRVSQHRNSSLQGKSPPRLTVTHFDSLYTFSMYQFSVATITDYQKLDSSSKPNYLPKVSPLNAITFEIKSSIYELRWETQTFSPQKESLAQMSILSQRKYDCRQAYMGLIQNMKESETIVLPLSKFQRFYIELKILSFNFSQFI